MESTSRQREPGGLLNGETQYNHEYHLPTSVVNQSSSSTNADLHRNINNLDNTDIISTMSETSQSIPPTTTSTMTSPLDNFSPSKLLASSIHNQTRTMQAELQKFMSMLSPGSSGMAGVSANSGVSGNSTVSTSHGYELASVQDDEMTVINEEIRNSIQMLNAMLSVGEAAAAIKKHDLLTPPKQPLPDTSTTPSKEPLPHYERHPSNPVEKPPSNLEQPIAKLLIKLTPKKRGRGRPRKTPEKGTDTFQCKKKESPKNETSPVKVLYVCGLCEKTLTSKKFLKRHMDIHERERNKLLGLDSIVKKEPVSDDDTIEDNSLYQIVEEDMNLNDILVGDEVITVGIDDGNVVADDGVINTDEIKEEVKTEKSPRKRGHYACEECGMFFDKKTTRAKHIVSVHGKKHPYQCPDCPRSYLFKSRLRRHRITHSNEKPFQCSECDKRFARNDVLKSHMFIHTDSNSTLKCDVCKKRYTDEEEFNRHCATHRPVSCPECDKSFMLASKLTRHMLIHQTEAAYNCDVCSKGFVTADRLNTHMLIHTMDANYKPHLCSICGKSFSRRSSLYQHQLSHSTIRNFMCKVCGMAFSNGCKLRRHEVIHSSDRPFMCDLCPATFKLQTRLNHHRVGHNCERTHFCEECGKGFMRHQTLRAHMRVHTGIKTCECGICHRMFQSRHHLKRHMLVHSGEKPHICAECGKSFARKDKLALHMPVHTGGVYVRKRVQEKIPINPSFIQGNTTDETTDSMRYDINNIAETEKIVRYDVNKIVDKTTVRYDVNRIDSNNEPQLSNSSVMSHSGISIPANSMSLPASMALPITINPEFLSLSSQRYDLINTDGKSLAPTSYISIPPSLRTGDRYNDQAIDYSGFSLSNTDFKRMHDSFRAYSAT